MAIRGMTVRLTTLLQCPNPPAVVRLYRDQNYPGDVQRVFVTLNSGYASENVTGTYIAANGAATIQVGSGKWQDLSGCLAFQPFTVTVNTGALVNGQEPVTDFDCLPMTLARVRRTDDLLALRRDVSGIRSTLADILGTITDFDLDTRGQHDPRRDALARLQSERVPAKGHLDEEDDELDRVADDDR